MPVYYIYISTQCKVLPMNPQYFSMYHKSIERYVNNQKSNLTKQLAVAVFSQSKPITCSSCQCWQLIITVEHILSIFVFKYNWNKIYNMLIFSYSQWIWSLTSCSPIILQVFFEKQVHWECSLPVKANTNWQNPNTFLPLFDFNFIMNYVTRVNKVRRANLSGIHAWFLLDLLNLIGSSYVMEVLITVCKGSFYFKLEQKLNLWLK